MSSEEERPFLDASGGELTRRRFLEMAAAVTTITATGACNRERTQIVPYVNRPAGILPGNFLTYATSMSRDGFATGLLVATREARPVKVEGNPDHPASLGATGPIEQASLMELYDPRRGRTMTLRGNPIGWRGVLRRLQERAERLEARGGAGLAFLLEPSGSLFHASLRGRLAERFPRAMFRTYAPLPREQEARGAEAAFGRTVMARYDFTRARTIVALDADFLEGAPGHLAYARAFADRREPEGSWMSRLYVAEARLSLQGMMADHRLAVRSAEVAPLSAALVHAVTQELGQGAVPEEVARSSAEGAPLGAAASRWIAAVARDLARSRGASIVLAGPRQPAEVHVLAFALNALLENLGVSVELTTPVLIDAHDGAGLRGIVDAIEGGAVDTLVMDAFDPVGTAPRDIDFGASLGPVEESLYLASYPDATAERATLYLPAAHPAEAWGEGRAFDGTSSIQQPLIEPLFGGVTIADVFLALLKEAGREPREALQEAWRARLVGQEFPGAWETALYRGTIGDTRLPAVPVRPRWDAVARALSAARRPAASGLEVDVVPDLRIGDGRHARNGWLVELPDPVTRLSWENAALVSPTFARERGLTSGDGIEIVSQGQTVHGPVLVVPLVADDTLVISAGWGRDVQTPWGKPGGLDAFAVRRSDAPYFAVGATLRRTGKSHRLADVQGASSQEGRELALGMTLGELREGRTLAEKRAPLDSLYAPYPYEGLKWGMSIDLGRCIACAACVAACNAENNIPVVGREEVLKGREMQWLRVDRYFDEGPSGTSVITQPLACVHCENAPCEYVCPVNATVHSSEGLNQMVYNRCVGTRFCSNNCPYKVRRFNFFGYQAENAEVEKMRMNPEVTVRSRGVMEKCTYCVQRIERARIDAESAGRPLRGDGVRTACEQACPTSAISFGSLNEPTSRVALLHEDPRSYRLLHDLGTRPRTAHLARVRNPNPELA